MVAGSAVLVLKAEGSAVNTGVGVNVGDLVTVKVISGVTVNTGLTGLVLLYNCPSVACDNGNP